MIRPIHGSGSCDVRINTLKYASFDTLEEADEAAFAWSKNWADVSGKRITVWHDGKLVKEYKGEACFH